MTKVFFHCMDRIRKYGDNDFHIQMAGGWSKRGLRRLRYFGERLMRLNADVRTVSWRTIDNGLLWLAMNVGFAINQGVDVHVWGLCSEDFEMRRDDVFVFDDYTGTYGDIRVKSSARYHVGKNRGIYVAPEGVERELFVLAYRRKSWRVIHDYVLEIPELGMCYCANDECYCGGSGEVFEELRLLAVRKLMSMS